jgi:predicted metal-dependent phosphoesterase TrpH
VLIDLHTHSNASDGADRPARVVQVAREAGLDVVALTDHDTFAGLPEAMAALPPGLTLVPGVEISCYTEEGARRISLHLLAYLCDPAYPPLATELVHLQAGRAARARRIVEMMVDHGIAISWEQVERIAGPAAVVGRPHIAQALVELGLIATVGEAFSPDWLGNRGRFYVQKDELEVLDAIALVSAAGGVAVFAHPEAAKRGAVVGEQTYEAMAAAGLWGLEADHPDHDAEQARRVRSIALSLGLRVTGSSDYHGSRKPTSIGACVTAEDVYADLVARGRGSAPVTG